MLQPLPSDIIQVVVAADNNYVMPLAVTVCSAAVNAAPERRLAFNVVHDGITAENRTRVNQSLARVRITNASIEWIQAPLSKFKDLRITHHWITPLTFVRLLVPDLLPTSVDKAIYLDCDVAVMEDIGGLWDLDLGDKSLLAAQDLIGWVSDPSAGLANYRELGFPPDKKYFNAGVLVLNLRKWRISNTPQALLDYLREYREVIRASDQEALNAVLGNDWGNSTSDGIGKLRLESTVSAHTRWGGALQISERASFIFTVARSHGCPPVITLSARRSFAT